jgi:PAS domain S-box-containing protein
MLLSPSKFNDILFHRPRWSVIQCYLFAVALVGAASAIMMLINTIANVSVLVFGVFYLALILTAWFAGYHAALVALALGALSSLYFFTPPHYSIILSDLAYGLELILYLLVGAVIINLTHMLRGALGEADQERRRLQAVLDSLPVGVFIANPDGSITETNAHIAAVWGETPDIERISQYSLFRAWWTDTGKPVRAHEWAMARALQHGEVSTGEVIDIQGFDGVRRTILNSAAPIRDQNGDILGGVVAVQDITRQRETERALREREALYRALWDETFEAKVLVDMKTETVVDINQSYIELFGYTAEEFVGRNVGESAALIFPPESFAAMATRAQHEPEKPIEVEMQRRDGTRLIVEIRTRVLHLENGRELHMTSHRDMTAQREAERALREREALYRALWDSTFDAKVLHEGGTILEVNRTFIEQFGYTSADLLGKNGIEVITAPESRAEVAKHIAAESETPYRAILLRGDGSRFAAEIRARTINVNNHHVRLASLRDVSAEEHAVASEQARLEERARRQVLASFMNNVSHDFKTPISTINTSLYLLEKTTDRQRQLERMKVIGQQANRLTQLVEGMLTITELDNDPRLECSPLDLNRLLRMLEEKYSPKAREKGLAFPLDLAPDTLVISADERTLHRAFSEVVKNALHYTQKGTVTLRSRCAGNTAVIEIEDTGVGIPPEEHARIFERLYRVDEARGSDTGGIGLGLAIARAIFHLHDGEIEVESEVGKGSVFRVTLPLTIPSPVVSAAG